MDMPTPPILVGVKREARTIPALLVTGKTNYVYVFDRVTGEAFYGLEDRPVRRSDDPDDQSWPVQPFPTKPGPIGRVGMTRDDISKLTPEIEKFCTGFWDSHNIQPSSAYTRPVTGAATVRFPSSVGGPNWGPLSYNPQLGYVFINLHNSGSYAAGRCCWRGGGGGRGFATATSPQPKRPRKAGGARRRRRSERRQGGGRGGGGQGGGGARGGQLSNSPTGSSGNSAPCSRAAVRRLVAVDVNTGDIAWTSTLGINENLAELGDVGLKTGTRNLGGSIATAGGLVFIGATNDHRFRAFDAKTGKEVWVTELPASGHSTPITYMGKDGAQYVAIAASGGTSVGNGLQISDQLVAFKLGGGQ
jgi:quinoprotein glucose dehydrogenase